jgi:hypothetical protein
MTEEFKNRYSVKIYVDPNAGSTTPIITGYRAKSSIDTGAFYAPYIPLQTTGTKMTDGRITAQGQSQGWTTFIIGGEGAEVVQWCRENLGRRHRGIYLQGLDLWLGNGGRWRADGRTLGEVGFLSNYVRIWLHREEDIALFKLRWS